MSLKRFKVEKLVRDHMPEIIRKLGIVVHEQILDPNDFIIKLKDKLLEESEEVRRSSSQQELLEELADVLEVISSISAANGLTMKQVEEKRLKKREAKGGFDRKIYNSYVEVDANNPAINYYTKNPQQYPEVHIESHKADCIFCQIARLERKVNFYAKFNHCYVIKDEFPVSKGHILIIPNNHTENWFMAKEEVRLDMMQALHLMKEKLDLECSPHGYNIGANCGEAAGQTVMHLHLHLIPRYHGDMENPRGGVRGVIPSKQKY